jgi:LysM repeat protein
MKLVKIFGIVMAFHGIAFMFIFAIPGCRSTTKKPAIAAPVAETESPLVGTETGSPFMSSEPEPTTAPVRFSPTRPGTPAAAEVIAQTPAASSTHVVVKGDSLWTIARKNGLTVKELAAANKLRSDATLKLGQKLVVPGKAPAAVAPAASITAKSNVAPSPSKSTITHVVKSGDTLGGIAKKYQVKVGDIATANNIADPTKIRVGQSLKIPGWQAPASKPAASTVRVTPTVPVTAPALSEPAAQPLSPVFSSPLESTPAPTPAPVADPESPFVTPAPSPDAPIIRVEESGAPRIE